MDTLKTLIATNPHKLLNKKKKKKRKLDNFYLYINYFTHMNLVN